MPTGSFVQVAIPLYFEGHAYRAGSRIRVTIAAPNGTQPVWSFGETQPRAAQRRYRSSSRAARHPASCSRSSRASSVPTGLPPCPSLRNEPCRAYTGP